MSETMTVEAAELADRVERLVESLDGIRGCRADAGNGEIRSIAVTAEPGRNPERLVREVRGAVLAYLGQTVSVDRIRIELPPEGRRETEPEHRRGLEEPPLPGRGLRGGEEDFWREDQERRARPAKEPEPRARPAEAREPGNRPAEPGPRSSSGPVEVELNEYRIVGGRGAGVVVRVSVRDRNGRSYEGAVSADSLATVRSDTFVQAAVHAGRRLMEEVVRDPAQGRTAGRELKVAGQDDGVRVGDDRFFTVTLEGLNGGGRFRATGFEATSGKVGADVAIAATLDALRRLVRGRGIRVSDAEDF